MTTVPRGTPRCSKKNGVDIPNDTTRATIFESCMKSTKHQAVGPKICEPAMQQSTASTNYQQTQAVQTPGSPPQRQHGLPHLDTSGPPTARHSNRLNDPLLSPIHDAVDFAINKPSICRRSPPTRTNNHPPLPSPMPPTIYLLFRLRRCYFSSSERASIPLYFRLIPLIPF